MKKTLSLLLSFVMLLSVFSGMQITANAETYLLNKAGVFNMDNSSREYTIKLKNKTKLKINYKTNYPSYIYIEEQKYFDDMLDLEFIKSCSRQITLDAGTYVIGIGFNFNDYYYDSDFVMPSKIDFSLKVSDVTTYTTSIKMKSTSKSMQKGNSLTLGYTKTPSNSRIKSITWKSSNTNVATVNKNGKVTAKNLGKATITAKLNNGKTAKCNVKVNKVKRIKVVKKHSKSLSSYVKYVNGRKKGKWSSSNTKIATVSKSGKVTAKSTGKCTIYFKAGGVKYSIPVSCVNLVSIYPSNVDNEEVFNDAWVKVVNNSNKKITYMELDIYQYNSNGKRLKSPYEYYYIDETIAANSTEYYYFWVNDHTKYTKVKLTKVKFSDGTVWRP